MVEKAKKINTPILVGLVLFEIVFVFFLIMTIRQFFKRDTEVVKAGISNYSVLLEEGTVGEDGKNLKLGLDETQKSIIEGVLYDEISLNHIGNVGNQNAKIRDDNSVYYVYIKDLNIYFINFIVDIEDLRQSYRVVYRWSDDPQNENIPQNVPALAFCLEENELKYGDFKCKDKYGGYGKDIVVHDLLKNKIFSNAILDLKGNVYNEEPLDIHIYVDSNKNFEQEVAIGEISSYLSGVGFNLEDFKFIVNTNFVY